MAIKNFHIDNAERASWNAKVDSQNGTANNLKINSGTAVLSNATIANILINAGIANLNSATIADATINGGKAILSSADITGAIIRSGIATLSNASIGTGNLTTANVTTLNIATAINMANGATLNYQGTNILDISGRLWTARYNDIAEWMHKANPNEKISPGDILAMTESGIVIANKKLNRQVVGVFSDTFGYSLGGKIDVVDQSENFPEYLPVGLIGRVNVKVIGSIKNGDLLTTSKIPGVAKKAGKMFYSGTIIGKALESHNGNGIDRISMLIMNC